MLIVITSNITSLTQGHLWHEEMYNHLHNTDKFGVTLDFIKKFNTMTFQWIPVLRLHGRNPPLGSMKEIQHWTI